MTTVVLAPDEGKEITVGNSKLLVKLLSEATGNTMTITEYELAPQFPGPPAHQHKVFEHAWYVLEGNLTIQLKNEISVLTKGSFVFIPKKVVHAFSNRSNAVVKVLTIDTPGGFEKYYDDLQAAFGNGQSIDQERMQEIQLKYDTYPPDYVFK
jgi:quercetin dioxygenase-like cupin family protein